MRGLTSPHKQKQVLQLVGNHHFAFLTEVKNQCHLSGAWHEFHSDCHGAGGATILLNTTTFPHATLLHTSEHAVAVQANDTVFISLYIPCHARWADAAYVLDWIPVPPLKCIIGGDWNSFATDPRWLEALGSRGLLLCPCPSPFTRMSYTGQTSLLDRVASNTDVRIEHVETKAFTDHVALMVRVGPAPTDVPRFPRHLLGNKDYCKRLDEIAQYFAHMILEADSAQRKCELWDLFKSFVLQDAIRFVKKERRKANATYTKQQRTIFNPSSSNQGRLEAKRVCDIIETNAFEQDAHERSVHRMKSWEQPCHDFYKLGMERSPSFQLPNVAPEAMLSQATDFYRNLFAEEPVRPVPSLLEHVNGFGSDVPNLHFSAFTIVRALKYCQKNKAPGPDSIPMEVWKRLGPVIAEPMAEICNRASPHCLPRSWRNGVISLISKCKEGQLPRSLNDARPITLLNTDYKVFSKALALHLGHHMPQLSVAEQRAFVHGRDIRHNIILAESLLYREPQPDGALLSLDWAKAYDRVSYDYLSRVLEAYRFNPSLVNKLKATMYGFTLSLASPDNNQPCFPRGRGVGQGCPCAPLLFTLAINPLAMALKARLSGIQVSSHPARRSKVALCADDTLILVSSHEDCRIAQDLLEQYMAASGASLNWDKSKAIMLGSWKNIPSPFPCPVLSQDEQLRYLGIFLSGAERPPNPWQAKLPKIKARLELWERFKPSLFARANVALTMIASCARYHASCAAASEGAIKELQAL